MTLSRKRFSATIAEITTAWRTLPDPGEPVVWQRDEEGAWRASVGRLTVWRSERHYWCAQVRSAVWDCHSQWHPSRSAAMLAAEGMLRAMIAAGERALG